MSRAREILRGLRCRIFGHRDVRAIPHAEICEHPWNRDHDGVDVADIPPDRLCRYCDSDWLPNKEVKS